MPDGVEGKGPKLWALPVETCYITVLYNICESLKRASLGCLIAFSPYQEIGYFHQPLR